MKRINQKTICVAAICSLSMAALAAEDTRTALDMKYDSGTREVAVERISNLCPLRLTPVVDARQNQETIGASMHGALLSGGISKWATDGLNNLNEFGATIDIGNTEAAPANGILIKTTLTRAYTWQVGLKLFSMVAVKVQFINNQGVIQEKYYRAHGDKTNMWGADAEYVTTLNYGINNLLPVMAKDLVKLCAGSQVEEYTYAGPTERSK